MEILLIVLLVLLIVGVLPTWPHSSRWGYTPTTILGILLIVLLVLVLTGRI